MRARADEPVAGLPPGPDLPRARQTARISMRPLAFMEETRARFGDVFTVRALDERPWVMVSDPELIGQVFRAPAGVLRAGAAKRRVLAPLLGHTSLLLLDEREHAEQRRLLLPAFSRERIASQTGAMVEAAERAMDRRPLGREGPATELTRAIALDVIVRAVFGGGDEERLERLRRRLGELRLPGNSREGWTEAFARLVAPVDELVFAAIAEGAAGTGGDDVLSVLLAAREEGGQTMTDRDIRDELMTMLVAGYETTATTLAWALERLARNPAALAAVEREGAGGPYTEAAIKETLRSRPALPTVARLVAEPFELGGFLLPPGAEIRVAVLLVHHRPDIYPEPEAFRPERFLEHAPDPRAWLPFGGGARRCIGARFALHELRVVLAALLARATVSAEGPEPEAMRHRDITLTPARGAPVVFRAR